MGLGGVLLALWIGLLLASARSNGLLSFEGLLTLAPFFCVSVYVVSRVRECFSSDASHSSAEPRARIVPLRRFS